MTIIFSEILQAGKEKSNIDNSLADWVAYLLFVAYLKLQFS